MALGSKSYILESVNRCWTSRHERRDFPGICRAVEEVNLPV